MHLQNYWLTHCPIIAPFLSKALDFFVNECKASNQISELDYLHGIYGRGFEGLNSALLELKKFIFYNFSSEKSMNLQFSIFLSRLRRIILCDKRYYVSNNKSSLFYEKWRDFSPVYQIYGPDPLYWLWDICSIILNLGALCFMAYYLENE